MKHHMERGYLLQNLPKIFTFVEADRTEDNIDNRIANLRYALRYLQGLKAIKWREAKAELRSLNLTFHIMDVLEEIKIEAFQEGREEGIEEGIEVGIEKGIEKEKFFACRNMLRKGFDAETISGIMEVSIDYIQNITGQIIKEPQVVQLLLAGNDDGQIATSLDVSHYLVEAVRKDLNKKA